MVWQDQFCTILLIIEWKSRIIHCWIKNEHFYFYFYLFFYTMCSLSFVTRTLIQCKLGFRFLVCVYKLSIVMPRKVQFIFLIRSILTWKVDLCSSSRQTNMFRSYEYQTTRFTRSSLFWRFVFWCEATGLPYVSIRTEVNVFLPYLRLCIGMRPLPILYIFGQYKCRRSTTGSRQVKVNRMELSLFSLAKHFHME
jgi:hypothetical protein